MERTTAVVEATSNAAFESALLPIALDLCATLGEHDRYERLLESVMRVIPADAASFMRLDSEGTLVPVAARGLSSEVLGRRFSASENPRLEEILRAGSVVRFPADYHLPDPFDELFLEDVWCERVHACMGCVLRVDDELIGILTLDSHRPDAFDHVPTTHVELAAALLAAAFRTAMLVSKLEKAVVQQSRVSSLLQEEVSSRAGAEFLGTSDVAAHVRREIEMLAGTDLTVLIMGETGVGKEVVARSIHAQSARADKAILYVNCAALPEAIAESELFGHTRGAFTGANEHRAGKFETAHEGTLFLDEVGELPLSIQAKLLRVLQTGELQRVGSDRTTHVDVRVIAATNRQLDREVAEGRFRADLYHRLSVYPLVVAPLRERERDALVLAGYFLDGARARLGLPPVRLTAAARDALLSYDWPGNVRELEHLLQRAALRASNGRRGTSSVIVDAEHLGLAPSLHAPIGAPLSAMEKRRPRPRLPLHEAIERFKREVVRDALEEANGNLSQAARALQVDRGNLHRLAKRLSVIGGDV